jgi:hypothetical protein
MRTKPPKTPTPALGRWHCAALDDGAPPPFPGALWQPGEGNAKIRKTLEHIDEEYRVWGHTMDPGSVEICPRATPGCKAGCVTRGGLAQAFPSITASRRLKNLAYLASPERYLRQLADQLVCIVEQTQREDIWRGNIGSDTDTRESVKIANRELAARGLPKQRFYDYTKVPEHLGQRAGNHFLCFSRSETNEPQALELLHAGEIVAVVFHQVGPYAGNAAYRQRLPETWRGFPVHDGDVSDIRIPGFTDPPRPENGRGYVIGLRLKGNNRQREAAIQRGFSVEHQPEDK